VKRWNALRAVCKLRYALFVRRWRLPLPLVTFSLAEVDVILRLAAEIEGGRELICLMLDEP
jgi:hypothetical protein